MNYRATSAALLLALSLSACASSGGVQDVARISDPVQREQAIAALRAAAPKPIEGNGGAFMSPFTSDGVTARVGHQCHGRAECRRHRGGRRTGRR